MALRYQKPKVSVNRGMIKKTFEARGLQYVSELIIQNIYDLIIIIQWNESHNIKFYRMSSDMFPWMSEYNFDDLPDIETIKSLLSQLKIIIKKYNHRITYHPGQFNNLASPKKQVVQNTIIDLNKHAQIMDMIGLSQTPYNKINIHIGGTYKEKDTTLKRWCENFHLLSESAQKRLTIENDDKKNCYKVEDLLYAHEQLKIPIVLDTHHHNLNNGISLEEAFNLAVNTWPTNIPPVIHMSEPRENNSRAHHDYIKNKINVFGYDVDIMFEAKQKEQAILYYKKLYS